VRTVISDLTGLQSIVFDNLLHNCAANGDAGKTWPGCRNGSHLRANITLSVICSGGEIPALLFTTGSCPVPGSVVDTPPNGLTRFQRPRVVKKERVDRLGCLHYRPSLTFCLTRTQLCVIHKDAMARTGRPPIPAPERQSRLIALRLTKEEYKTLERAAAKAKLTVSEYIRQSMGLRRGE